MEKLVRTYIESEELCKPEDKILVALSGGVDSVVLLHLLTQLNYKVGLAHCNFSLRDNESDADEDFTRKLAEQYGLPYFSKQFDTVSYAQDNKLSIEMAARDLRYDWFEELLRTEDYDLLATGHHVNDSIETLFLNLCRGTGINGLVGIKSKYKTVIRPLLSASREQIELYAKEHMLNYRYDASNDSMKYMRNIVRHQVIPAMRKINPSFDSVMERNMGYLEQSADIYNTEISRMKRLVVKEKGSVLSLDVTKLLEQRNTEALLYEILASLGFNHSIVSDIFSCLPNGIGRMFYSNSHQLLIDRNKILVELIEEKTITKVELTNFDELRSYFNKVELIDMSKFDLVKDNSVACLDLDLVKFPLNICSWESGDSFHPLGMDKRKKVSDFLIDTKVSRFEKKKIKILKADNQILWIINHRIDNRFKVSQSTKRVLLIHS